jgi:transcriptional regulator with XRE-family HTH domain
MAKLRPPDFGRVIRERRRELNLTQQDVARRIKTSVPYIGHLESEKRHPSARVVSKLARVLGLDERELFFLANPGTRERVFQQPESPRPSTWDAFARDEKLHQFHRITRPEMDTLLQVALMGEVRSSLDYIYILIAIRQALGLWDLHRLS